ncbi:hypothetical protein [Cronobacter dublinensis]|uniref:hypothetical protein n=1 Tax=Cronobacter dublinensis TaxID=413497 RepID=UPI000CFCDBF5|nr:hypothetical protein [Cronobacter dublinensis]
MSNISEDRVEALAAACAEKVKQLEFSVKQSAFDSVRQELETELAIARVALLALRERAEPVAWVPQYQLDLLKKSVIVEADLSSMQRFDEVPLYAEPPAPVADDDSEIKWRELALQFDGHRMQAICFLKQILKELPESEFSSARDFLKSGPLSGEEVLRNRIADLAQPATVVPEWTNQQCLEFLAIAFRHAEIKGDFELDDLRLGVKMANAMTPGKEG